MDGAPCLIIRIGSFEAINLVLLILIGSLEAVYIVQLILIGGFEVSDLSLVCSVGDLKIRVGCLKSSKLGLKRSDSGLKLIEVFLFDERS